MPAQGGKCRAGRASFVGEVLAALLLGGTWLMPESLLGQGMPTATLTGRVALEDGTPCGGALVSLASPSLQGTRSVATAASGAYLVALLPPGDFLVTVAAEGFEAVSRPVQLSAGSTSRLDIALRLATVEDSVTVVAPEGGASNASETVVDFSLSAAKVSSMPIDRTPQAVALLAPGVNDNGPISNIGSANARPGLMISGAPSYDSLFLVNGVIVNENLRGQPHDLFIEDAIAETRVETGRISAEYGRFTGGVVNVITRSGGNDLAGSLRLTLDNERWASNNRFDGDAGVESRSSRTDDTWEATLGGAFATDRLWYFTAGRQASREATRSTTATSLLGDVALTPASYLYESEERRFETKLTGSLTPRHQLVASYIDFRLDESNSTFNPIVLDTRMLVPVSYPSTLLALHYGGMLAERVYLEAQYSRLRSAVEQGGEELPDRIRGTWLLDPLRQGARFHSPVFRPGTQRFDNDSWQTKASWLMPTERLGSHELRAGVERVENLTRSTLPFSGSDFDIRTTRTIVRGTEVFPVLSRGTLVEYNPVLQPTRGVQMATDSAFLNDRLTLGRRWTINLGLRYDRSDDRIGDGLMVSRHGTWSPRLAVAFDPASDGRLAFDVGYARYAARNADSAAVFSLAGGGAASRFSWAYEGPCINCDPFAPTSELVPTSEALRLLFEWFDSVGGTASQPNVAAEIPGFSTRLQSGGLRAPNVVERSLGAVLRLGGAGFVRAELVHREWHDAYSSRIDRTTGFTTPDPYYGRTYDLAVLESSSALERTYRALQTQFSYRASQAFHFGGSYTWSRLEGNFTPEIRCCAASPSELGEYPEYTETRWNHPTGPLSSFGRAGWPAVDQQHRARLWIGGELAVRRGRIAVTLLQALDSGRPYEAVGFIDPRPWVDNPGYRTPPARVAYFFSPPAAFRTDTITRTDFALVWTMPGPRGIEFFVKPEVSNLFDEQAVVAVDTTVLTAVNDRTLHAFDPFRETPSEGRHYRLGPQFGEPLGAPGYQSPRTFRIGLGVRF
jgi:hypothetical protein